MRPYDPIPLVVLCALVVLSVVTQDCDNAHLAQDLWCMKRDPLQNLHFHFSW